MRISIDMDDIEARMAYDRMWSDLKVGERIAVYLDGEIVEYAVTADDVAGEVTIYAGDEMHRLRKIIRKGRVEIKVERKPDAHD